MASSLAENDSRPLRDKTYGSSADIVGETNVAHRDNSSVLGFMREIRLFRNQVCRARMKEIRVYE